MTEIFVPVFFFQYIVLAEFLVHLGHILEQARNAQLSSAQLRVQMCAKIIMKFIKLLRKK